MDTINEKILLLKEKLGMLMAVSKNLNNDEVVWLSQKLDKLICEYYFYKK